MKSFVLAPFRSIALKVQTYWDAALLTYNIERHDWNYVVHYILQRTSTSTSSSSNIMMATTTTTNTNASEDHVHSYSSTSTTSSNRKLPVSILKLALEENAPFAVIDAILKATPGLASKYEKVRTYCKDTSRYVTRHEYPLHVACDKGLRRNNTDSAKIIMALIKDHPYALHVKHWYTNDYPIYTMLKTYTFFILNLDNSYSCNSSDNDKIKAILKVAVAMIQIYPQAASHRSNDTKKFLVEDVILGVFGVVTNEVGLLIKALVEAYPKAAEENYTYGSGYLLHLFCNLDYSEQYENSNDLLNHFSSILNAYPDAVNYRNNYAGLPIHCLCGKEHISLTLLRTLVEANPQSIFEHVKIVPHHPHLHPPAEYHPTLCSFLLSHVNHRRAAGTSGQPINVSDNEKEIIEYIVRVTYMNDSHVPADQKLYGSIPTFHGAIYYGAPFYAVQKLLQVSWYPIAFEQHDQYGMLPVHYACMEPYNYYNETINAQTTTLCNSNNTSTTTNNNKGNDDATMSSSNNRSLDQVNTIFYLLLCYPGALHSATVD